MNNNIIFQLPLIGIITDIDIRINVLIGHPLEDQEITGPFGRIMADKIIIIAGQGFIRNDRYPLAGAQERNGISMGMYKDITGHALRSPPFGRFADRSNGLLVLWSLWTNRTTANRASTGNSIQYSMVRIRHPHQVIDIM